MQTLTERKRKSERMTEEERKAFQQYVSSFPTKIDAAAAIGVSRQALDGILLRGSSKPEIIQTIRERLQSAA